MRLRSSTFALASLLSASPLLAAEAGRQLRAQLGGDASAPFAVENLAGRMHVSAGPGDTVTAVATVHAESEELAQAVRFEQVVGDKGIPTLRVRYPVDRYKAYRFGSAGRSSDSSGSLFSVLAGLFSFGGDSSIRYDGARVSVGSNRGVLLYADVEVQVPRRTLAATFRNVVGPLAAEGVQGRVRLDSSSGNITARGLTGEVVADTGSGDVKADDGKGSFRCDTGSGNCEVRGFSGESLSCDTGSGDVRLERVAARRLKLATGSGNVSVRDADAEEVDADTGSGDVEVDVPGERLARLKADTGSGNVHLRLAPSAGFEARAKTGSGDVVSRFADAQAIHDGRKIVGYRRGDGRVRILVDTGSGDVVLQPVP